MLCLSILNTFIKNMCCHCDYVYLDMKYKVKVNVLLECVTVIKVQYVVS